MKILHVAETAKGGVGSYLDELIPLQALHFGQSRVRAIIPTQHRAQLPSLSNDQLFMFDRPDRSVRTLRQLRSCVMNALAEFNPDILHLHSSFAGLIGRLPLRRHSTHKIFYNPHGWGFEMWATGPKRYVVASVERLLAGRCNRIIAVSEAERIQAIHAGLPAERMAVVVSGISDRRRGGAAEWVDTRLKVLFVGRLDRQKGIDTLARIARRHETEIAVRVIGGSVVGHSRADLSSSNIEYLGWLPRSEIDAHMRACDLVAMPSRWEALGISAIEAMRSSKPVLAFAVGGLPEVVEDTVTGRLVEAGNVSLFEQALLSGTLDDWALMGHAARQRFEQRFMSDRMAGELLSVYAES
jgi:glycosyltransferase involved in cell wall biosynthesis